MSSKTRKFLSKIFWFLMFLGILFAGLPLRNYVLAHVNASTPLSVAGYADYSYDYTDPATLTSTPPEITGEKPESKLWWNDGFWWASMFSPSAGSYHIFRLNWGTHTWEDTQTPLDDRPDSKADTLWDASANKLYVVSHRHTLLGTTVKDSINAGRLYRFTYDADTQTYLLDTGFPVTVNKDKTETLVLTKASNGWLWVTYVSRIPPSEDYKVYVNQSKNDGLSWGTPFVIPVTNTESLVSSDDISSIIAFKDSGEGKVGVVWSNQLDGKLYMATHSDSNSDPSSGWVLETLPYPTTPIDDHINIKTATSASQDQLFIAVKSDTVPEQPDAALVGLITRDTDGTYSFHQYSTMKDNDTRPIVLVNEGDPSTTADDTAMVFVAGNPDGSDICYKELAIKSPLSDMGDFTSGNCGTPFISDQAIDNIDNPTSTKQNVNNVTGVVVLASDDFNGKMYVHNEAGNPPPVVTSRSPDFNATGVPVNSVIRVTFSKDMKASSINMSSFLVEKGSTPITGVVQYDAATRTATFTPDTLLDSSTTYTVQLTQAIQDTTGLALNQGFDNSNPREQWSFGTAGTEVMFSSDNYSVNEADGTATITVTLNAPSSQSVTVDYATADGTATAGSDYTQASGTLTFASGEITKTFDVPILNDTTQEGDENLQLALSNPTNATLAEPSSAVLTIVDDDGPLTVQFKSPTYNATEADGSAQIQVILNRADSNTVYVDYATSDGTALGGLDYTVVTGTLQFDPGQVEKSFDVPITQDNLKEDNETVGLHLSNATGDSLALGTMKDAVLTIEDSNAEPTVQFTSSSYTVAEDGGQATIELSLTTASSKPVTVTYSTADLLATAGEDYTATSGDLVFNPGETTASFNIPILTDGIDEENETVQLSIDNPVNAVLGTPDSAVLTINDVDPTPTVFFNQAYYTVNESDGEATIIVKLSAASGRSVSVDYATSDGTATAGQDYTAQSGTLTFAPGETSKSFTVPILTDTVNEPDETINLTLSGAVDADLGTPSNAFLTILGEQKVIYLPFIANK